MGMISEFRDFALKGNVFDLAIGVIIGAAFGKITTSLIENLLNPILGLAGQVNFTEMYAMLSSKATYAEGMKYADAKSNGVALGYGAFITDVINFLILAFVVFLMVKAFNTARKRFEAQKPVAAPAGPSNEEKLLIEIRDLLAKRA
jgi:large conductance mechanosensitive channel